MTTPPRPPGDRTPTSNPVLRRALLWGAVLAAVIAVVGGIIGFVVAGSEGLRERPARHAHRGGVHGHHGREHPPREPVRGLRRLRRRVLRIVLGGWLLKFILFIVLVVVLRDADWLNPSCSSWRSSPA